MNNALGMFVAAMLSLPAMAQNPSLPVVGAGQTFAFGDGLNSKHATKITGTGLGYALPAPSQGEFSQTISRTVSVLVVDTSGLPSNFLIKYNAIDTADAGIQTADPLVGRSVEARVIGAGINISSKDGKALSDTDRGYFAEDAQKFRDYLLAATKFSTLKFSATDYQDVSAQLVGNLMGLTKGEVKTTSIRQRPGLAIPTFDVRMSVVASQSEPSEIPVSGTMTIQKDWSALDVLVENKTTRTSGSVKDNIQLVIDTSWSLRLSRIMVKQ